MVPEGSPDATVVAVRKINDLDFYNLGLYDLARRLKISPTKLLWLIRNDGMQTDPEFFKEIRIGKSLHKRYSGKCLETLKAKLATTDLDAAYANRKLAKLPG